jgi:hypothetical protein
VVVEFNWAHASKSLRTAEIQLKQQWDGDARQLPSALVRFAVLPVSSWSMNAGRSREMNVRGPLRRSVLRRGR